MKKKGSALLHSSIALLLCVSMLVGTTFAWFTDSVSTGLNTIVAGALDVELYHSNAAVQDEKVDSNTRLFMDLKGKPILWEPGAVSYENLRVANEGDLALVYQMAINTANENYIMDPSGNRYGLFQVLKVGLVDGGITATDRAGVVASVNEGSWLTMETFLINGSLLPAGAGESEKTWGVVIYWEPSDIDNLWNLNNGKQLDSGDALSIDLGISLLATQESYEFDSFGSDYDADAKGFVFPDFVGGSASATVIPDSQNQIVAGARMTSGKVTVTVPAGTQVVPGTTQLKMTVTEKLFSDANIQLSETENMLSLDVHVEGVAADNTTPITVELREVAPKGLNMGNYKLYHVESDGTKEMTLVDSAADFTAHNQFTYDSATGDVTLYMATFSEVSLIADTINPWGGNYDYSWYHAGIETLTISNADELAGFGAIVGGMNGQTQDNFSGKTVNLICDINLGDKDDASINLLYPIGYCNEADCYTKPTDGAATAANVSAFQGTFDGQGHIIANFYQNTWQMWGDYDGNNYKAAMGLFGYVHGGTVKNLTVDNFSSDGEFTPTGVIAAYADGGATFENIAITNCNPRVYNTGNGGIIGIAGDTGAANDDHITLKNITVDHSNKISALWGSWDVACGGLVGMYRGNVDGNGVATGDTITFTNCHVAAQIDVNNDVCANYQYYAYRYAGMIIGSIRHNTTNVGGCSIPDMTGVSAAGCTVNFGSWNDYYYCELVDNSIASYTHDYQFSRLTKVDTLPESASGTAHYYVKNADGTVTCRHFINGALHEHADSGTQTVDGKTVAVENNVCVYLPFDQLFTGYGWGVDSRSIDELDGITIQIVESEQNESVPKFGVNVDSTTYRVSNGSTVEVGELFKALDGVSINDNSVVVSVSPKDPATTVTGTYLPNASDWTKSKLQFSGTGVVILTIQDYQYCTPTVLELEVVNSNHIHISFDDVEKCLGNLKSKTYASLYEEPFFGWLKGLHDTYGAKFSLYTYNSVLQGVPATYAAEFAAASDWLKIGLHAENSGSTYASSSYDQGKTAWSTFSGHVKTITGTTDSIDRMPRLHYFAGSQAALRGMRDAESGALGFLAADDSRNSYYFDSTTSSGLYNTNHITDLNNGLVFLNTDMRGDWFLSTFTSSNNYRKPTSETVYGEMQARYASGAYDEMLEWCIFFSHEWQFYNGTTLGTGKTWTEDACKFAYDNGITFGYPQEYAFGRTEHDIPIDDGTTAVFDGVSLQIVDDFGKVQFVNGYTINGSGLQFEAKTARAISRTQVLKVSDNMRNLSLDLTKLSITNKLYYTVYEFSDRPLNSTTFKVGGGNWTQADVTLADTTQYIIIIFKNGTDAAFTEADLALLNQCVRFGETEDTEDTDEPAADATTTTRNGETVTIVSSLSDMFYVQGSFAGGINSTEATSVTGRAISRYYVLKVNGGETLNLLQNIEGVTLYFAIKEFTAIPLTAENITSGGQTYQSWLSDSVSLQANTRYIVIGFKNGDGTSGFSDEQLEKLSSCLAMCDEDGVLQETGSAES